MNTFFDKIYIVSLKRSQDRHEALKKRLNGLDYELFWGVDGREENVGDLERKGLYNHKQYNLNRLSRGENPRVLNMGRVGCALSHVNIYKNIIEKKYGKVLILEDDIIVYDSRIETFKKGISELPKDWELLYLGHNGSNNSYSMTARTKYAIYKLLNLCGFHKYNPETYRNLYPRVYSKYLERSGHHWGTHSYAVTQDGAKKILKYQQPVTREADNLIAELCKFELIQSYTLRNHLFRQDRELEGTIVNR